MTITTYSRSSGKTYNTLMEWLQKCGKDDTYLRSIIKEKIRQITNNWDRCPQCGAIVPAIQYECPQCGWEFGFSSFSL